MSRFLRKISVKDYSSTGISGRAFKCRPKDLETGLSLHLITKELSDDNFYRYWVSQTTGSKRPGLCWLENKQFREAGADLPVASEDKADQDFGLLHYTTTCPQYLDGSRDDGGKLVRDILAKLAFENGMLRPALKDGIEKPPLSKPVPEVDW